MLQCLVPDKNFLYQPPMQNIPKEGLRLLPGKGCKGTAPCPLAVERPVYILCRSSKVGRLS